jgi:hypothetical protein
MNPPLDFRPYQLAIVVGVDYKILHFVEDIAPSDPRNTLRLRYLDFLRDITDRYPVDVICEEAKHGTESIAEAVADQQALRYCNIEMSPQLRAELGIPPMYTVDPESEIPPEKKAHWNDQREAHMVYELLGAISGARAVIVICGVLHMPVIVQTLRTKFARVEPYDVTTLGWFDRSLL